MSSESYDSASLTSFSLISFSLSLPSFSISYFSFSSIDYFEVFSYFSRSIITFSLFFTISTTTSFLIFSFFMLLKLGGMTYEIKLFFFSVFPLFDCCYNISIKLNGFATTGILGLTNSYVKISFFFSFGLL